MLVPGRATLAPYDDLLAGRKTHGGVRGGVAARASDRCSTTARSTSRPSGRGACPTRMRQAPGLDGCGPVLGCWRVFVAFGKPRGAALSPYAASIVYFASLGAGFIAVELALLQHLTLLLGHPIFTLSMLLFTLLASSGLGSAFTRPL